MLSSHDQQRTLVGEAPSCETSQSLLDGVAQGGGARQIETALATLLTF